MVQKKLYFCHREKIFAHNRNFGLSDSGTGAAEEVFGARV